MGRLCANDLGVNVGVCFGDYTVAPRVPSVMTGGGGCVCCLLTCAGLTVLDRSLTTLSWPVCSGHAIDLARMHGAQYPIEPPEVIFVHPTPRHPHVYTNGHSTLEASRFHSVHIL